MAQVTRRVVCAPYFSDKSVTICMRAPPHGSFKLSTPWLQPLEPKCNIPRCLLTVYKTRLHNYLLYHAICARLKRSLSNQVRCWISRVILRKGGPKLEACFCDCWCFSFLMYFWLLVPLWLDYDELILSLIVLTYVVFMAQTYPPHPSEVFSYSSCCTFLTSIPHTYYTESLRILTWSAFCNIASVDTCSASIYLSRLAIICEIPARDQYDHFILLLLWITESSLVLDCVCKMFGGFSFCRVHLCCAISRNTHQCFGS